MRVNKFVYLWVLKGDYGFGWEDLTASEKRREVVSDLKAYQRNDPNVVRLKIVHRREPNPTWVSG